MKNITRKLAFVAMMLGFMLQVNAQTVFIPEAGAEYRIKIADGENAGKSLTYKGYNSSSDGIRPQFEDANTTDAYQVFRFTLQKGTATVDGSPEYFIESVVDKNISALNDRGGFSDARSDTWHTMRVYEDEGKYAIKMVGSGTNNQRFTLYLNGTTFGYRTNGSDAEYKNEPPTADYDFVFEKVTDVDNTSLLAKLTYVEAVMEKVEAKGTDAFGTTVLGQYNETLYNALTTAYATAKSAESSTSFADIYQNESKLTVALNDLFASVAVPEGNYYMWNTYQTNFIGRIDNNPGSYLRFFGFNHGQDNLLFAFVKNADNSIQIQYNDSRRIDEQQYYLATDTRGTTDAASAANTYFYYDISKGTYAIGFDGGGFLYFNDDNTASIETRKRGSVLSDEYLFITIMENSKVQSFADLQDAVKRAISLQASLADDGYEYNPDLVALLESTLAESEELLKYPTSITDMDDAVATLNKLITAYPKGRMFKVNATFEAADWVGKESGNGALNNDDNGIYYGGTNNGSTFMVGSFDFSSIEELTDIVIEYATIDSKREGIDIYITDPLDEANIIASTGTLTATSYWTIPETASAVPTINVKRALRATSVSGIQEVYVKYLNTVANIWSVKFEGTDVPAGIQKTEAGASIIAQNGLINASFDGSAAIKLYTISGQLIDQTIVEGDYSQTVNQGIYILMINDKAYKAVVK